MELESANVDDADDLVALRDRLARWLLSRDIQQWRPQQLSPRQLRARIEAGYVFVHRVEGQIVAAVCVRWNDPLIWGADHSDAGYVHLLMTDRGWAGMGLGGRVLAWAEDHIRQHDRKLARLDVTASNGALQDWYRARGYAQVGRRQFGHEDWNDVALFEKQL